jgi:hypothetical protein
MLIDETTHHRGHSVVTRLSFRPEPFVVVVVNPEMYLPSHPSSDGVALSIRHALHRRLQGRARPTWLGGTRLSKRRRAAIRTAIERLELETDGYARMLGRRLGRSSSSRPDLARGFGRATGSSGSFASRTRRSFMNSRIATMTPTTATNAGKNSKSSTVRRGRL